MTSTHTSSSEGRDLAVPTSGELLHAIAYKSIAITPLMLVSLEALHQQSVEANRRHAITGVLLYNAGHFMQYIEGPSADVMRLYRRIQGDSRHRRVTELMNEPVARRAFAQWHMGLAQAAASELLAISTASWLRESRAEPVAAKHSPGMALLLAFWQNR